MNALPFRALLQRRLVWLLWLALLLPMAQMAATSHLYSHANQEQGAPADGRQALVHAHCDLCVSAAALVAGGPLATALAVTHPAVRQQSPVERLTDVWSALTVSGYRSRAPPFALR